MSEQVCRAYVGKPLLLYSYPGIFALEVENRSFNACRKSQQHGLSLSSAMVHVCAYEGGGNVNGHGWWGCCFPIHSKSVCLCVSPLHERERREKLLWYFKGKELQQHWRRTTLSAWRVTGHIWLTHCSTCLRRSIHSSNVISDVTPFKIIGIYTIDC